MDKQSRRALMLSALVLGGTLLLLHAVSEILLPFVVGLVLAYLINPTVTRLHAAGLPRPLAAALPVGAAVSALALALILGLPALVEQISSFARRLPVYLMTLEHFVIPDRYSGLLSMQLSADNLLRRIGLMGTKGAEWTVQALQSTLSGAFWLLNLLLLVVMTPMVAFYLLMDWPDIMKKGMQQLPSRWRAKVRATAAEIDVKMAAYLRGTLTVCLGMGVFYAAALMMTGPIASVLSGRHVASLELAWAIGLFTGLIAFLPVIGATVGLMLMMAVALVQYQLQLWEPYALILGIFVVGQLLEGYVMTPMLVGNRVGLHPLWVIFALLAGGALAGILGMLAALPVAVVVSVLLPKLLKLWRESVD